MARINLDHQSSTPAHPEVLAAMLPYFVERYGSPSALHQEGLLAREALDKARGQVARLIGAGSPEEIIFTSNGTEAANLAVKGTAWANQKRGHHIVATAIEHPAVMQSLDFLVAHGFTCAKVNPDREGWIDPEAVRAALTDKTVLICAHHANHDLGTIEPIREIGALACERGIPLFVDATASGGWLSIDVKTLGISLLSLSPHRFYGPKGVGVLYRHRQARLTSLIHGGIQEGGRRAGTENVPAIVGAGVAAELALRDQAQWLTRATELQRVLWCGLSEKIPGVHLHGPPLGLRRLAANLNFSVAGVEGEALLLRSDLNGIALASGSSCLGRSLQVPPVLAAIGVDHHLARSNVLMTLGKDNTIQEIDLVLRLFPEVVEKLRALSPSWTPSANLE